MPVLPLFHIVNRPSLPARRTRSATRSSASSPTWRLARRDSSITPQSGEAAVEDLVREVVVNINMLANTTTISPHRAPRASVQVASPQEVLAQEFSPLQGLPLTTLQNQHRGTLLGKHSFDKLQCFTESIQCAQRKYIFIMCVAAFTRKSK